MKREMLSRVSIFLVVTMVVCHLFATNASADPIDPIFVDTNAAPGGSGGSWADAFNNLQAAISASTSGDEIWVAAGVYKPDDGSGIRTATFAVKSGTALYGGFAGNETTLEQRNWRVNETVLTGDLAGNDDDSIDSSYDDNSFHVLTILSGSPVVDGFIITGGYASEDTDPYTDPEPANPNNYGGGLRIETNDLIGPTIINCLFIMNKAEWGGAISNKRANPRVLQSVFNNNKAYKRGGAIFYDAVGYGSYVVNSVFINNRSDSLNGGGGIFINNEFIGQSGSILLHNSIFWENSSGLAGYSGQQIGIRDKGSENDYKLYASYCYIQGGRDGIYVDEAGLDTFNIIDNISEPETGPGFVDAQGADGLPGNWDDNFHLQSNSFCIDTGLNTFYFDSEPIPLDVDFDLQDRIYNDIIDMGVYERTHIIHVDKDATGMNDGTNWHDAFKYLQHGLSAAESGNEIWVAEGTYNPTTGVAQPGDTFAMRREYTFALKSGVGIYGGFNGTEKQRSERNWLTNETILSGDINMKYETDNSYNVVTAIADETAILDGFTIRRGYAEKLSPDKFSRGAGIHGGNASIVNCKIQSNYAINGGGMYGGMSSIGNLFNCRFLSNHADTGGAFYAETNSSYQLTNCSFLDNTADMGGAIYMNSGGSHLLTNCTLSRNNAASLGGGIYAYSAFATVYNSIIWGNTAAVDGHELALVDSYPEIFRTALPDGPHDLYKDNGSYSGSYIVQSDPLFADTQGRLSPGSPCIDSGDSGAVPLDISDIDNDGDTAERIPIDLDGLARFVDDPVVVDKGIADPPDYPQIVDMGAYERQHPMEVCEADLDNDADVDAFDLEMFCANYGRTTCSNCPGDFRGDGDVDGADFHTMAWDYGKTDCAAP